MRSCRNECKKVSIGQYQWCSRDRNLRNRDLVKTSETESPWLHQKFRDWESRLQNLWIFLKFFKKMLSSLLSLFFRISGIFPTCFGCFLPANAMNKKLVELWNFYQAISFRYSNSQDNRLWPRPVAPSPRQDLRDWDRDTRKGVSRRVSRPRRSLETPSLVSTLKQSWRDNAKLVVLSWFLSFDSSSRHPSKQLTAWSTILPLKYSGNRFTEVLLFLVKLTKTFVSDLWSQFVSRSQNHICDP